MNKEPNIYKYIPFIIIILMLAKFIFEPGNLLWFVSSFKSLFFALIIIYLLDPVVKYLKKKLKISHTMSVVLTFIIVVLIISFFIMLIIPAILGSVDLLLNNFPSKLEIDNMISGLNINDFLKEEIVTSILIVLKNSVSSLSKYLVSFSGHIITSISALMKNIALFCLAIIMSFYALRDWNEINYKILKIITACIPNKYNTNAIKIIRLTNKAIKTFIIGKLYTCIILGLLTSISIYFINLISPLNIPYVPLIGCIIGITNIIPYIGPVIGIVLSTILAIFSGVYEAIVLVIVIVVMQQIDNVIICPKVLGDSMGLKPFWIVASVTIGGGFFGVIGMVLSVPVASVILTIITENFNTKDYTV